MIRNYTVLNFGAGIQWITTIISYTDLNTAAGTAHQQVYLYDAGGNALTLPQGGRVLGWRIKPLVKPTGTGPLSALTIGLGWSGSVAAINTTPYDTFVTVGDTAEQSGLLTATNAPGDAAWKPMADFIQTGLSSSWADLLTGKFQIDLIVLTPSTPST